MYYTLTLYIYLGDESSHFENLFFLSKSIEIWFSTHLYVGNIFINTYRHLSGKTS